MNTIPNRIWVINSIVSFFFFNTVRQYHPSFRSYFHTRVELVIHVARRPNLLWRSCDVNDFLQKWRILHLQITISLFISFLN